MEGKTGVVVFLLVILFMIWLNESGKLAKIKAIMAGPANPSSGVLGGVLSGIGGVIMPIPGGPLIGPIGNGTGGVGPPQKK